MTAVLPQKTRVPDTAQLHETARQAYRDSVEQGEPLSSYTLGKRFDRSRTWARARINEVSAEPGMPTPVDEAPAEVVPADQGQACLPVAETPAEADSAPAEKPVDASADEGGTPTPRRVRSWPVLLLALPAFVAIWGGWVGLGEMAGFGPVNLLPGIGAGWTVNTAITLPIGVEAYAAYALRVWLSGLAPTELARRFAMWSAISSLVLGMAGQAAYHLMDEAGWTSAPWQVTTFVSCLPVVVLGCGAALAHLLHNGSR